MSSTEQVTTYSDQERSFLLDLALASIRHGLAHGQPLPVALDLLPPALLQQRACFVTLNKSGQLRGCIGSLQAHRPLAQDVSANAHAAAFRDPRFEPVQLAEVPELEFHISILTAPEPMRFASEQDLLAQIRPGIDGLILQDGRHRGTFLPSVWEQLPDVASFWAHLKRKAGLPVDHWSETVQVQRYRTESISQAG